MVRDSSPKTIKSNPNLTVVIPTYNESEVIDHRIKNLNDINYPTKNIDVIVVDDQSSDGTVELAKEAFEKYGISGEVIVKEKRTGTNASVNLGVSKANTDIVVTTDADVTFEENALNYAIGRLLSDEQIGAVCGELEPIIKEKSFTTSSEKAYRTVYGKMCTWESNIHSTYCFNGPLIVLKKKAFSPIPETHGASDAGMALKIIHNGYRCIYEANARFYEYITDDLSQQRRQKLRRSARLLEATLYNLDLISPKYGKFGLFVFPLRFMMFFIAPTAFFTSVILWSYLLAQINLLYGIMIWIAFFLALLSGNVRSNLVSSFIWHQIYLLVSLTRMFRGMHVWKAVEREKV
ncbi:glycosyltransferase [Methanococcoides alaskense]|uniref:Cellulose synthase/poly-beta-1,6-N-acetylglucosamine synthase-like glycosyltransferase n=1 Tax=Methanococcoides alaskense TaxID=325778 RepID=A0AA90ZCV6_9EURY|nr:glycosyltransferase [Methanococcoides alaskense]MDA0524834.1 glycosyltransferase [Methanococcoides alaskense]MDR6223042.1 cellulose synthase/poly-beta-1,6-N-acetylglucosamine synthase-like glycosyltransferase [Methanococcoides alaskense]